MDSITTIAPSSPQSLQAPQRNSFAELGSEDFFKLMIAQLTNQDPLEPTGNQELFDQIASIRDIEMSSSLTKTLESLTGGQRFASGSSMIGQFVTSIPGASGSVQQGLVVGVRFEADGSSVLLLADGSELPLEQVATIQPPLDVARSVMGQLVSGLNNSVGNIVEGLVSGVRMDDSGEIMLELDSGESIRFRDMAGIGSTPGQAF